MESKMLQQLSKVLKIGGKTNIPFPVMVISRDLFFPPSTRQVSTPLPASKLRVLLSSWCDVVFFNGTLLGLHKSGAPLP